jgi:hypothetical protein
VATAIEAVGCMYVRGGEDKIVMRDRQTDTDSEREEDAGGFLS